VRQRAARQAPALVGRQEGTISPAAERPSDVVRREGGREKRPPVMRCARTALRVMYRGAAEQFPAMSPRRGTPAAPKWQKRPSARRRGTGEKERSVCFQREGRQESRNVALQARQRQRTQQQGMSVWWRPVQNVPSRAGQERTAPAEAVREGSRGRVRQDVLQNSQAIARPRCRRLQSEARLQCCGRQVVPRSMREGRGVEVHPGAAALVGRAAGRGRGTGKTRQ